MFQDILDKREMEVQDNLQSFYNDLKGTGVKGLPDDYNIFKSALSDPVNAKGFYEDLKGSGVVEGLPDSFEAFSTILPGNNYFTNTTVIDNPVSLENLQKGLTDFDEQNKGFFEEWKSYQKNLKEATKVHDPYKVSELLNYVRKNAEKYNNLSKERDQLIEGIYTHPELSEKRKAESERIDSSMKDIDTFVESIDNHNALRFVSGVNPIYLSDGEREQAREIRRLDEAKKIYKDTKEMLQAPSKYDKSNGFLNFLKGGGDTFNNRDFWSAGMTQIARNLDIRDILEKVNKNRDGKDIENFLTKGEQSLLDAFLTQTTVQSERANDLSGGYMAGQSAAQSVDFMAEFLATGGLAAAASGAAKKAVMRWIIKHTPSSSLRREMAKGVAWMTESGLGTLARTPVMPSTYRSVTDELLQYKTDNEGNVLLDENNQPILKSGWESFWDGFTDSLIENVSELSAEHIAGTLGVLGKATHKVLPKNIQSMFKKTGDSIASWKPVELYSNFSKTPVYKFLKETGFNGFVPEMAEEWYGNGLRAMLGDTAALKDFATVENQLITVAAFLPMSLIGGSVSAVQMVRTKGRYENSLKTLQGVLSDLGYKQDQVDYFIDQVNASSAREMAKTITPIINRIAMENEEKGKEVFKAVSDFVYAKGSYHMLNGAYTEQMGERKKAEDERLMKETGGYVNSATGKVQIVTDKEGNRAFLVGESIDADHKVYVLNYGGKKITLSREDFEEGCNLENEFEKDEFLSVLIMNKDIENESANFEDTDEAEQAKLNLENPENREQAEVPQTGLGQLSYKGQPVSIVENEVQDDGTILVENEEGEAMRVPAKDLEGMMKPDVPEITSEESFQPEGNVQAESIKEIPLTKAGKPDYNAMLETDPEMFASEWEKRSTPEKAKATLERQSENIGKRIETLQGKVEKETDLNKIADIEDEIADLLHRKEIIDEVIKSRYTSRVIEIENVEEAAPKVQDNTTNVQTQNEDILEFKEEIEPVGRGFFGNIYDQFRGKAKEAIHFLLQRKEGEAIGALHHPEVGDIDLVWGKEGSGKSDGFGLAKLSKYHPEVLDKLQEILDEMKVIKRTENRVNLESDTHKAAVRLEWDGKRKNWLLTAFEKEVPTSIDKTTDTGENQNDLQSDTALLQNVGPSLENKGNESVIENQEDKVENTENTPVNIPRARIRHLDGKEYTGDIVKEEKGRITIKDDVSGREISAPKKRVIERSEQPNANSRFTQQVNIDKRKKVSNPIPDIKEEERTILSEKKDNGSIREGQGGEVEKVSIKQQKGNDQLKFIQFRYFDGSIYYGKIIAKKDDRFVVKSDNGRICRIKDDRILTRYRSEEEMKEVSAEETERDISGDVRFRHDNTPEFINDRFNKELQQQIEGTLPQGHVYRLGNPNNLLRSAGIPDLSIELAASRLSLKASEVYENNHPFELSAVMNLPDAIQNPIAVFDSKTRAGSKVIMTELTDSRGKHFVVAMQTNIPKNRYGRRTIQINDIRSVYPKDNVHDIVNWINRGNLLKWADKTKLRNWLTQQRSNSAEVASPVFEFNVATNIVENYENPTFLEGEISSEVDRISDELGVKVNKIKNRGELPEGIQKRMKDGRYPGLFDPRTGKVWIITDEVTDVADVQATMLHEIVGHKGIHGLFGDQLPEFCKKVLDSLKTDERAQLVKEYNGNEQLAAEEYVARFAEGYENPAMWEKVKAIVKEFFRGIGIDLKLNDNDLKYILWKAKNRLKEGDRMLETIEKTARNREIERKLWGRDIKEDSFEEVNRLFNEELDRYENGKMSKNEVFHLGKPSGVLNSFLPSLPIVMYQRVVKKGIEKKHKVDLNAVKNMPSFLSSPIFIFKRNQNTLGILTEMKDREGKSVCVAIEMSKSMQEGKSVIEVNDVTSFHGRREGNIIHPLNRNGTLVWVDKEKGFDWISSVNPDESQEISNQDLLDATNIIKNFENPKIDEGVVRQRKVGGKLQEGDDSIEKVNQRFNKLLERSNEEDIGKITFDLGFPSDILRAGGVENKPIKLYGSKVIKKMKKHGFLLKELKNLPEAVARPIAIFNNLDRRGNRSILTELKTENGNFLVTIDLGKGEDVDFDIVSSVFGKKDTSVVHWINKGYLTSVDKEKALSYLHLSAPIAEASNNQELSSATNIIKNFENPKLNNGSEGVLFRKVPDEDFSKRHLNFTERTREELQDRMLSVKLLLDEVKRRGGKVTDYANPYIAENLATSKSKAQIENFDKNVWGPLLDTVKAFSERGKSFDDTDMYMMAKHAPERNARIKEVNNKEDGSGISDEEAKQIVEEFEKGFTKDEIDDFWNKVRAVTRFTTETQRKHGLIDKETKDYYDKMYEYYVPLRGWRESEAKEIEYLSDSRTTGAINLNKKAEGRSSIADSPLAYIANMAHSAIVVGNKNDIKRNVFEMMVLNKNPDLYQLKKVYRVNAGTQAEPIWVEQMEKPATELWMAGRVEVVTDHRNDAGRTRYQTKEQQVEVFVNGQRYIMEFNGNMGTQVANAINGMNLRRADGLQNTIGRVTRWMSANYTSRNPAFVVTNFMRDFGYAIPAYWMKGGNAVILMKNMPKAFAAIHNDLAGKGIGSEIQQLYNEFKENGGLTGYVHMTDIESYKKQIKREIRRSMGEKTFGDLAFRNVAMRWGASALEYLAQMSENSTRFAVYMSERQSGKSATQAAYAAKEITTNFNRKGRSSGVIGSLFAFFNATVQGSANAIDLARRSPGKFSVYCAGIIMMQYFASALCRVFGGEDEIGESNYNRLSDWVKYNNLVLPDVFGVGDGKFITIPLPHFFRALSSLGVIAGEVMNGVKITGQGIESLFDAIAGDLTPVEIATPQFKNLNSLSRSLMPTMIKPYMEAYVYNRNFMNLPVSRSPYSVSQEGIIPQYKLATHKTNPLLVDLAKWLNEVSGGGDYTTSEISFDPETGDVGRNGWKSWGDLNPAKFEHLVEGIFGGRLTFFNNIWKTAKSVVSEGEVETVNIPVLRRLYQSPYGSSAWEKFYEVRDQVADIDAKASEFMKLGDYNNFVKVSSYKNASLVSVYKSYEKMIRRLNKAINLTKEGPVADMLKRQREDLVKDFALRMKGMEKRTLKNKVLVQ